MCVYPDTSLWIPDTASGSTNQSNSQKSTKEQNMSKKQVFLGGSCNPTTWRKTVSIPALVAAGVAFYNPQVDDWKPELVALEAAAKQDSEQLLFVIDGQTRAIASILEATEYACSGRQVVLVVENVPDGTVVEGQTITGRELKDLNRARSYLLDVAKRHPDNVKVFPNVADATSYLIEVLTK